MASAGQSAVRLVQLIAQTFPAFRDEAIYCGKQVFLYKRAQIAVADTWAAYGRKTEGASPYAFPDIGQLTCFADYRIPQLLRAEGVLEYDAALTAKVDGLVEIAPGSAEEVEIRAATVVAVERLRDVLNERIRAAKAGTSTALDSEGAGAPPPRRLRELTSVELDWYLWQIGERTKDAIPPHHRVNTIFY